MGYINPKVRFYYDPPVARHNLTKKKLFKQIKFVVKKNNKKESVKIMLILIIYMY